MHFRRGGRGFRFRFLDKVVVLTAYLAVRQRVALKLSKTSPGLQQTPQDDRDSIRPQPIVEANFKTG